MDDRKEDELGSDYETPDELEAGEFDRLSRSQKRRQLATIVSLLVIAGISAAYCSKIADLLKSIVDPSSAPQSSSRGIQVPLASPELSDPEELIRRPELLQQLKRATVRVIFRNKEFGDDYYSAGVLVNDRTIVTAKHCLTEGYDPSIVYVRETDDENGEEVKKAWTAGKRNVCRIVKHPHEDVDLAIIVFEKPIVGSDVPLPIASEQPPEGQPVAICGHPTNFRWEVIFGTMEEIGDDGLYNLDAEYTPGNSGGPLINHRGELLGVARSANVDTEKSFAQPVYQQDIYEMTRYADYLIAQFRAEQAERARARERQQEQQKEQERVRQDGVRDSLRLHLREQPDFFWYKPLPRRKTD